MRTRAERLLEEDRDYQAHTQDLIAYANHMWDDGARYRKGWRLHRRFWTRARGNAHLASRVEHLYVKRFFGNDLDRLFNWESGFRVAGKDHPNFVTLVIKGPAGAGKSTLGLQLGVQLAKRGNVCMYYSMEEERESLVQAAIDFGWQEPGQIVLDGVGHWYQGVIHGEPRPIRARIEELKREARKKLKRDAQETPRDMPSPGRRFLRRRADERAEPEPLIAAVLVSSLGHRAMGLEERRKQLYREWRELPDLLPACVVIDSLEGFANAPVGEEGTVGVARDQLLQLKDFFRDRCEVLVILAEDAGGETPAYVDYVADTIIEMSRRTDAGEGTVVAEILKSRNQYHAAGQHQIKIRSKLDVEIEARSDYPHLASILPEPGVQVIPSFAFRLQQARQQPSSEEVALSTGFTALDAILRHDRAKGMRRRSTTAVLGPPSSGKSLLAMNFLLQGVRENTRSLLISLQDDEVTIRERGVQQEPGAMRFWWAEEDGQAYHRFTWALDDLVRWWWLREHELGERLALDPREGRDPRPLVRLPYVFSEGPVPVGSSSQQALLESQATLQFLRRLVEACSSFTDGANPPTWDPDASMSVQAVYREAWSDFLRAAGPGVVPARNEEEAIGPKQIALRNGPDHGAPFLAWDSRAWDPESQKMRYDTSLLRVLYFRPGNITPEDMLDRIVREVGQPNESGAFGRVVVDDVEQIRQRLPLVAASPLFLPALIDILKAKGITAWFIGSPLDDRRDSTSYGLSVMADHVIQTSVGFCPGCAPQQESDGLPLAELFALPSDAVVKRHGNPQDRIAVVQVAARPGSSALPPYQLRVTLSPS